jgi:hypothetical protein
MPRRFGESTEKGTRCFPHVGQNVALVDLTGWGQEDDHRKSREAGFDHHLVKPVNYNALTKLLGETPEAARK